MTTIMKREKINVIVKLPGKPACIREIGATLEDYQNEVCGDIESIPFPGLDDVDIVVNDMGKLMGLQPNIIIPEYGDIIMGRIFIVGVDENTCLWKSIQPERVDEILSYLGKNSINK